MHFSDRLRYFSCGVDEPESCHIESGHAEGLREDFIESKDFLKVFLFLALEGLVQNFFCGLDDTRVLRESGLLRLILFNWSWSVVVEGLASRSVNAGQNLVSNPPCELLCGGFPFICVKFAHGIPVVRYPQNLAHVLCDQPRLAVDEHRTYRVASIGKNL